tara:strand:- start:128 stop:955 length:828 start_codon:yes stop_codon:yes gene_type:complete
MKNNKFALEKKFSSDFEKGLQKIGLKNTKNLFVTSNLESISKIRLPKKDKLEILLENMKKIMGKNYTIFSPSASLNFCNKDYVFDLKNTPSFQMGPLAEFIRLQKDSHRSMHPFWSVSAIGKNKNCLKSVSKHSYAYGSPWSKMLDLDTSQLNLGVHPSKAVTLIHHIETISGAPYRFNKEFECKILVKNKVKAEKFYLSVFFKNQNIKKRIKLNEHFFNELKRKRKLKYYKNKSGLEMWSFKMRDFFDIATKYFNQNIFNYLEFKPNLSFQKEL